MMVDEYYDNDKQPLVGVRKKWRNTIPQTFTLPTDVIDTLSWFSEKLGVKKSHLVMAAVFDYQNEETKRFLDEVEEFHQSILSMKES